MARTASVDAAVKAPAVRWTMSARTCRSRLRQAGFCRRRYTVRGLSPHWRAALSTVAPHARASSRASSAFLRCGLAIIALGRYRKMAGFVCGLSGCSPLGLLTCELLIAIDDDVTVQ